jgi:hypothetical protein
MKKWYKYYFILTVSLVFSFTTAYTNESKDGVSKDQNIANENFEDINLCELLSKDQVETVLPGAGEGYTAARGESLMEGVKSYQCSYNNEQFDLFTVIIHIASKEKDFNWIKPKKSIRDSYEDAKELKIGDGGWLYGDPDEMKVKVAKGFSVIQLELSCKNANEKSDALVELAQILAKKLK